MKATWLWITVALIIVIGAGALLWQASQSNQEESLAPAEEDEFMDEMFGEESGGQFIQMAPDASEEILPEDDSVADEVVVTMTDTGFSPATVRVSAGTKVTFVNNGQGGRWPASDPHPTHTALPGCDSGRELATGGTYSFTFESVGSWGYHDHLNPALRGTVVVE